MNKINAGMAIFAPRKVPIIRAVGMLARNARNVG